MRTCSASRTTGRQTPSTQLWTFDMSHKEQIPTIPVTAQKIMSHPNFARGLDEVRNGRAFDWRIYDKLWAYERGRLFGKIAPVTMPLRINGELNPKAIALWCAASARNLVI